MKSNLVHSHVTAQYAGISPERLFETYMDSKEHAAATRESASIVPTVGGSFSAYDGYLTGTFIKIVSGQLVIQSWRSKHFKDSDPDAVLLIKFRKNEYDAGEIEMVLTNVPDDLNRHDNSSWNYHYWERFRSYFLNSRQITR